MSETNTFEESFNFEGNLKKKVKNLRKWVSRYFRLSPTVLTEYFKKPKMTSSDSMVKETEVKTYSWPLSTFGVITISDSVKKFKIFFENGTELELMAIDEDNCKTWMKKIKSATEKLKEYIRESEISRSVSLIINNQHLGNEIIRGIIGDSDLTPDKLNEYRQTFSQITSDEKFVDEKFANENSRFLSIINQTSSPKISITCPEGNITPSERRRKRSYSFRKFIPSPRHRLSYRRHSKSLSRGEQLNSNPSNEKKETSTLFSRRKSFVKLICRTDADLNEKQEEIKVSQDSDDDSERRQSSISLLTNELDEFLKISQAYTDLQNDIAEKQKKKEGYVKQCEELTKQYSQRGEEVEKMKNRINGISEATLQKRHLTLIEKERQLEIEFKKLKETRKVINVSIEFHREQSDKIRAKNLELQEKEKIINEKINKIQKRRCELAAKDHELKLKDNEIDKEAEDLNSKILQYNNQARLLNEKSFALRRNREENVRREKELHEWKKQLEMNHKQKLQVQKQKGGIEAKKVNSKIGGKKDILTFENNNIAKEKEKDIQSNIHCESKEQKESKTE